MDHPVPHGDRDKLVKFWIFGEKGVGKSALVQKFVVSHHSMDSTINYAYYIIRLDGCHGLKVALL